MLDAPFTMPRQARQPPPDPGDIAPRELPALLAAGNSVGSFVIQHVLARDDVGATYAATSSGAFAVAIDEYLPARLARRGAGGAVCLHDAGERAPFDIGLAAFVAEADRCARWGHPSLARLGPAWEASGTAYRPRFVPQGRSLREWQAAQTGAPDEAWVRRLIDALLDGLDWLHGDGQAHGAVGADRVLIGDDGQVVLLEPGAARAALASRLPGMPSGHEPGRLAPERRTARPPPASAEADLYALAVLAHGCLVGPAPGREAAVLAPSGTLRVALERIILAEPARRPRSVAAMREMLDAAASGARAQTGPVEEASPFQPKIAADADPLEWRADRSPAVAAAAAWPDIAPGELEPPPWKRAEPGLFAAAAPQRPDTPAVAPPEPERVPEPAWETALPRRRTAAATALSKPSRSSMPPRHRVAARASVRRWPWLLTGLAVGAVLTLVLARGPAQSWAELQRWGATLGVTQPAVPAAPVEAAAAAVTAPEPRSAAEPSGAPPPVLVEPQPPVTEATAAAPVEPPAVEAAAPTPVEAPAPPDRAAVTVRPPASPLAACGARSNFSLVWCMRQQCERAVYARHRQCLDLRASDALR